MLCLWRKLQLSLHRRDARAGAQTPQTTLQLHRSRTVSVPLPSVLLPPNAPLPFLVPKQLAAGGPAALAGASGVSW